MAFSLVSYLLSLCLNSHRLQDSRTIRKIASVDPYTVLAFAGLTADARVLIDRVRVEAQSYRLNVEDAPSVEYTARYLAGLQQKYTQQGGVRPFGIATLIAGVDHANPDQPLLYQTDPAGTHSRWKAQVIGGSNAKTLREFLEQHYAADLDEAATTKLAVQALLEVVDSGAQTMQVCVVTAGGKHRMLEESEIQGIAKQLESESSGENQ